MNCEAIRFTLMCTWFAQKLHGLIGRNSEFERDSECESESSVHCVVNCLGE